MAQKNLIGLVAGFFSNKSVSNHVYKEEAPLALKNTNSVASSGVSRYIDAHKHRSSVSGVSKYIKKQEKNTISGVAKYIVRQAVSERQRNSASSSTGVERYLRAQKPAVTVVRTGVTRYLDKAEKAKVSRVTKYVVKKNIADRNKPKQKATGVAHYLENRKEHLTTGVSKYVIKQNVAEKQRAVVEAVVVPRKPTGVEKYLQGKA